MGFEVEATDQWIYTRLAGDATIAGLITADNIDPYVAPLSSTSPGQLPGVKFPRIGFSLASAVDFPGLGIIRLLARLTYQVGVVQYHFEDGATAAQLLKRIDELMGKAVREIVIDEVGDRYMISGRRLMILPRYTERLEGTEDFFIHTRALYRFDVTGFQF